MIRSSSTKQRKLRKRLFWIFQRDSIEGQLDCLVRSAFWPSRSFRDYVKEVNS